MSDPTVERLDVAAYSIPTDAPEADGTLAWDSTTLVVVHAHGGGQVGLGWTYTGAAAATVVSEKLAAVVQGRSIMDVPGCWWEMHKAIRNMGRPGIVATAIAAVDVALWDLKARALGVPACLLLGRARPDAPVYGSGGFTTYDDERTREQLRHWAAEQRIPRVKIKIGESWGQREGRDLARVELARSVVGPDVELYVDANGAYTRKQAVRVGKALADLDVRWFEEPVSSDDLDGLRQVRDHVEVEVAAGEYGYDLYYFRAMLEAGAVDCIQADATRCAGWTGWLKAAALAEAHGMEISSHCAPHLHAHCGVAAPNLRHLEYFHDHVRILDLLFDGMVAPDGGALVPDTGRPGHGLAFKASDAEQYRVA